MSAAERAGPDVLADLLALASEAGAEKLLTTDRLLRNLAGPDAVDEAHRTWSARLREDLDQDPGHQDMDRPREEAPPDVDAFGLVGRLRADTSRGLRRAASRGRKGSR